MIKKKNAIILCSGGLDSIVTAHYVKRKLGYNKLKIIFFNYGQKTLLKEKKCSKLCAKKFGADFKEIALPELSEISTSLINRDGKIKKVINSELGDTKKESKKWYVPCRNLIFLSYAMAFAESLFIRKKGKYDIFVGFKCEGSESYPDTTEDFLNKINSLGKLTIGKIKVYAPLIKMDKEDIILLGEKLGVNFKETFSCYVGKREHCGFCLSCKLRQAGFYWANVLDPTKYKN